MKRTKKLLALLLAMAMTFSLAACGDSSNGGSGSGDGGGGSSDASYTAGICWYSFTDTFIASARQVVEGIAAKDGTVKVSSADSLGAIETQTSNMNNFYTQGVDYLVLNNLNTNGISDLCNMAEEKGVTLIFANTDSPSDDDFAAHEDLWLITSRAEVSGTIMGEALVEYWQNNPDADRNGNGQLDYIMLMGVQGSYDTIMRSTYAVKALTDAGIEVNCLGGDQLCDWSRATAQEKTAALLANYSDDIDAVIACNDDMALGAIEALKAGGFFGDSGKYIPVCGVDATAVGVEAVEEGTMLVTSLNNPVALGRGLYRLMYLLSTDQEITSENMNLEGADVEGHRIWLNYTAITKDNVADASYDITDTTF